MLAFDAVGRIVASFLFLGCGDDNATPVDASPERSPDIVLDATPDTDNCRRLWAVTDAAAGQTATVEGGALRFVAATLAPGAASIQVTQEASIAGDFDATFDVTVFAPGSIGAYVQAGVRPPAPATSFGTGGIGTIPSSGIRAAIQGGGGPSDIADTTATAATIRFQRTGDMLTVTTTAADATVATVMGGLSGNLSIGIELGNNHPTDATTSETSAEIASFTITQGGGAAMADTFDCDSLL